MNTPQNQRSTPNWPFPFRGANFQFIPRLALSHTVSGLFHLARPSSTRCTSININRVAEKKSSSLGGYFQRIPNSSCKPSRPKPRCARWVWVIALEFTTPRTIQWTVSNLHSEHNVYSHARAALWPSGPCPGADDGTRKMRFVVKMGIGWSSSKHERASSGGKIIRNAWCGFCTNNNKCANQAGRNK